MRKKFTEKQIKILDVAEELIAKKGFDGTSVRDICSKANINVAMISYYFGSKEKMMSYLYQYRVQRTKESFSEFAQTIKEGKPEMQMKEIVNYVISLLFKYSYFHGFVTQEMRSLDNVKDDLLEFYQTCVIRIEEIVKRGIVSGVFHNAPKSEDILTMIIGSALFVIRNKNFYEQYVPTNNEAQYQKESEQKLKNSILLSVFAILDYEQD
ncbi:MULTISPECIES: TetR/AcrR family transcriptional regulator [Epilithonimonas]|jgi:AcrR family transcriptional regulator|uniref:TetR/AcrR family transcriptional regulator n=1 Tax=Epilithonimonas vandammei TaxID=2487072 RepID=A0A3G8ZAJ3_9FLAO|nr:MULTISPECIES: TetR family transcriptional regulator [Epilithonimonas]AZI38755.1 TetR/AcrR family transcriptional regulator [Epilithonimonas vandammei]AZI53990.1 TetR/AcrR family transcriptional regulator [Epilithonimonas vandammei]HAP95021.1 TetR/AcrR family transcriptional regulator [Chryseobacterium sp.]